QQSYQAGPRQASRRYSCDVPRHGWISKNPERAVTMSGGDKSSELQEALSRGHYYPSFIRLEAAIEDHVPPMALARSYALGLRDAGLGPIVRYSLEGMGGELISGSQEDLEQGIARLGSEVPGYFAMMTKDKTHLTFARGIGGRSTWSVLGDYPAETVP